LAQSMLLGDRCTDIDAGAAAGIGKLVLFAGTELTGCGDSAYCAVSTFKEVIALLA
jgi:D-glycero-D-manno-heptose 1,7-bisphosphate phosphatase